MNAKKRKNIDKRRRRRQERRAKATAKLAVDHAEFAAWAATSMGQVLLDLNRKLYSNGALPPVEGT